MALKIQKLNWATLPLLIQGKKKEKKITWHYFQWWIKMLRKKLSLILSTLLIVAHCCFCRLFIKKMFYWMVFFSHSLSTAICFRCAIAECSIVKLLDFINDDIDWSVTKTIQHLMNLSCFENEIVPILFILETCISLLQKCMN